MTREMPQRPRGHVNETWSIRAFESLLPAEWLSHQFESDYGIDRRVEIFEDQTATGHFFNVQLKSQTTGSGQSPAVAIRRSTLNYWAELRDPTLIVIAHEPTQALWLRWSHLLGHDENPDTKSRQVRCDEVLDEESDRATAGGGGCVPLGSGADPPPSARRLPERGNALRGERKWPQESHRAEAVVASFLLSGRAR